MLYNLSSSSLIIYLNVLNENNVVLGFKRAPHHNHYQKKSERENFNRISTVLYLFAIINKISLTVSQQWQ